ncbi:MAG: thioredoxin [Patescibacteria group bacterium]
MPELNFIETTFDQEVLKSSVPVFIDFWAPWCGPCQMMGPIVEELAGEYGEDKIKIGKINVDESPALAGKYEVMSIPTFLMFKNGEVADKIVGGVTKERLKEMIGKHLTV